MSKSGLTMERTEDRNQRDDRYQFEIATEVLYPDGQEAEVSLADISATGALVRGYNETIQADDKVIFRFRNLGLLEAIVIRKTSDGFAARFRIGGGKHERLRDLFSSDPEPVLEKPVLKRASGKTKRKEVRLVLGQTEFQTCKLWSVRRVGVSVDLFVETAERPPIGADVSVGESNGFVQDYFAEGIIVRLEGGATSSTF